MPSRMRRFRKGVSGLAHEPAGALVVGGLGGGPGVLSHGVLRSRLLVAWLLRATGENTIIRVNSVLVKYLCSRCRPIRLVPMSVARTARDRVRDEVTREILEVAGTHLAQEGAAALSLRSIARDLGMAPSALYRYFDGRDALLSALIVAAYTSLADEAERAADLAGERAAGQSEASDAGTAVTAATLSAGWPCRAPCAPGRWLVPMNGASSSARRCRDTVRPKRRSFPTPGWLSRWCVRWPSRTGPAVSGLNCRSRRRRRRQRQRRLRVRPRSIQRWHPVRDVLMSDAPTSIVLRALQAWSTIIGAISLELFGHWRNAVLDPQLFFTETIIVPR